MVWLARVTFRFPPPDSWGDPTTVAWRQNTENAKEVRRFKKEMIRHEVDKVWAILNNHFMTAEATTLSGLDYPP